MDKFTSESKKASANSSMMGVGAYMGGHFCESKDSPDKVIKKIGLSTSFSKMLDQKEGSSQNAAKEYGL